MINVVFEIGENIVGKEEQCWLSAFTAFTRIEQNKILFRLEHDVHRLLNIKYKLNVQISRDLRL